MGKLFRLVLFLVYAFSLVPTAGALLGLWISPNTAWPLAFMGLVFPILLIVQFVFIILCLQEMVIQETGRFSLSRIREELKTMPHEYVEYNFAAPNRKHGMAIFSRYPVISSWSEHFPGTHNMVMYADLVIGPDTVRVFNNHLESIHFEKDEFQIIDNKSDESRITREKITVMFDRMKSAYGRRAIQAEMVHDKIKESPHPVIVCGDFNDTPVSYAVNKVRQGLYDSFRSGGSGMGTTFPNLILPMRIDYILHDKSMVSTSFQTGKEKFSDHRPVVASLTLGK